MDVTWAPGPHSPADGDSARPIGAQPSAMEGRPPLRLLPLLGILLFMGPVALGVVTRLHGGVQVGGFVLWFVALDLISLRFGYDSRDGADWKGASRDPSR